MNYPNGKPFYGNKSQVGRTHKEEKGKINYGGRGMSLENDIELSNTHYLKLGQAVIHKKPTPVQIVNVHYPMRLSLIHI